MVSKKILELFQLSEHHLKILFNENSRIERYLFILITADVHIFYNSSFFQSHMCVTISILLAALEQMTDDV